MSPAGHCWNYYSGDGSFLCTKRKSYENYSYKYNENHGYDPDSKIHGANVGPTWGRQDPGEPHVGHTNFAIWWYIQMNCDLSEWYGTPFTNIY